MKIRSPPGAETIATVAIWIYLLLAPFCLLSLYTQIVTQSAQMGLKVALVESRETSEHLLTVLESRDCFLLWSWGPYVEQDGVGSTLSEAKILECMGEDWQKLRENIDYSAQWPYVGGGDIK